MKTWSPIFTLIALLIIILTIPSYYTLAKHLDKEFDQERLNITLDNATKAMLVAASDVDSIELDYLSPESIILSPSNALDAFDAIMCISYDLEINSINKNIIENSVAAMVLCDEFGYCIADLVEDDLTPSNSTLGKDYTLRWSLRNPYTYIEEDGSVNTCSYNYYPLMTIQKNGVMTLKKSTVLDSDYKTKTKINQVINENVENAIKTEINRRNTGDTFAYKFHLPAQTTKLGVNPIKSPSAMVMLNNATYASKYSLDAVSVGGYRVTKREYIVCINEKGNKWYCYAKQLPESKYKYIEDYVKTQRDAVDKGYLPRMDWLSNERSLSNRESGK